jgi:DNA polymerase IV
VVLERQALDEEQPTLSLHESHSQSALDEAIDEIKAIGDVVQFVNEENQSSTDSSEEADKLKEENDIDVPAWQKSYQCMHAHDGTEGINNPNSKTIEVLSKMQQYYDRTQDQWRAISYRKVISKLKQTKEYIRTEEQARAYVLTLLY